MFRVGWLIHRVARVLAALLLFPVALAAAAPIVWAQQLASVDPAQMAAHPHPASESRFGRDLGGGEEALPLLSALRDDVRVDPFALGAEPSFSAEVLSYARIEDPMAADYFRLAGLYRFLQRRTRGTIDSMLREDVQRLALTRGDGLPFFEQEHREWLRELDRSRDPLWRLPWPRYRVGVYRPLRTTVLGERTTILRLGPLAIDNEMRIRIAARVACPDRPTGDDDGSPVIRPPEPWWPAWLYVSFRVHYAPTLSTIDPMAGLLRRYGVEMALDIMGEDRRIATVRVAYEGRGERSHAVTVSVVLATY